MKKRIVCVILTLILLVSLVPANVLTASAADMHISDKAITVLKQLEGYDSKCNARGYIGYGTLCEAATKTHGHGTACTKTGTCTNYNCVHTMSETEADVALREVLAELDKAINAFAGRNSLSLRQNQFDALVLFSFQNGTAWTTGTGDFKRAVTTRLGGNDFLNMIINWSVSDSNERRMIEADMYLNNLYPTSAPDKFIQVTFDTNGGSLETSKRTFYYDVTLSETKLPTPTKGDEIFRGWFSGSDWITKLTVDCDGLTLKAYWQGKDATASPSDLSPVHYSLNASNLAAKFIYTYSKTKGFEVSEEYVAGTVWVKAEHIDSKGNKWLKLSFADEYYKYNKTTKKHTKVEDKQWGADSELNKGVWVKAGTFSSGSGTAVGSDIDITVTVTNTYLNRRTQAGTDSAQNGTYSQGAKLRIVKTVINGNAVWGAVAKSESDKTIEGWVALMYTDYDVVKSQNTSTNYGTVIAKALIQVNGYVNLRSGAGTTNPIVGAVRNGTQVDLYETKYVNGHLWGRCNTGWFCLSYAEVTRLVAEQGANKDTGLTSYAFSFNVSASDKVYDAPGSSTEVTLDEALKSPVVISRLTVLSDGSTWGKVTAGWIKVSDSDEVELAAIAKFQTIVSGVPVRSSAETSAERIDTLTKGVEFNVEKIRVDMEGSTIWGKAQKTGENPNPTYFGWVNLTSAYVTRNNAPVVDDSSSVTLTGKIATVINTDSVKVREDHDIQSKQVGSLLRGTTLSVLDEKDGWYKLDVDPDNDPKTESWVFGGYLNVRDGVADTNGTNGSSDASQTGIGIVANTPTGVNLRRTPGTAGTFLGKIPEGTQVQILETTYVGATKWGRIETGWICMDYVTMMSYDQIPGGSGSAGSNGGSTTTTSQAAIFAGTVSGEVTVYKTTSQESDVVRTLADGTTVTVHEIITVTVSEEVTSEDNSGSTIETRITYWARVNDGYIFAPGENIDLDVLNDAPYTVNSENKLNVRTTAGATADDSTIKFKLRKGDFVTITMLQIVNDSLWGYAECDDGEGWVCMSYLTAGHISTNNNTDAEQSTPTAPPAANEPTQPSYGSTGNTDNVGGGTGTGTGYKYTGTIINNDKVNVRSRADLSSGVTISLKRGAAVVIYETTYNPADGMVWGRCDAGWIYLYYVDLVPAGGTAIDARVVFTDGTPIYSESTGGNQIGSYAKMAVVDIYEVVGKMARTDMGWINTDNLL